MGETLSTLTNSNPSSTMNTPPNTSQNPPPKPETEPAEHPKTPIQETPEKNPTDTNPAENETLLEREGDGEEEEEEGECGFCLFMKAGGCKNAFTEWEKCVEEGEKKNEEIVDKCFQATANLKTCMEAHSDYYAPLLQAEKAVEEEAVKQLEEEKGKEKLNDQESKEKGLDGSEKKETS